VKVRLHVLCLSALLASAPVCAEVFFLRDGDRITGKLVGQTVRNFRVQTSYGRLLIPKSKVERWQRADGREEILNPLVPADPARVAPKVLPPPRVVVAVVGSTFWHAWDKRDAPRDGSLRLELRLDEEILSAFTDTTLDPKDLPGATVNTFSFSPDHVEVMSAPNVQTLPAEIRPGRIVLKMDLPPGGAPSRRLRVAYQINSGTPEEPSWRDLVTGSTTISVGPDAPALVEVRQGRGQMDFSGFPRRRMKKVETFALEVVPATEP
jgi:hypothetical protein